MATGLDKLDYLHMDQVIKVDARLLRDTKNTLTTRTSLSIRRFANV
jgi:hypothetical protein